MAKPPRKRTSSHSALEEAVLQLAEEAPSPHEDVCGYLQATVLPVLGPALEQLLHHVYESQELQRALRERAEQEARPAAPASARRPSASNEPRPAASNEPRPTASDQLSRTVSAGMPAPPQSTTDEQSDVSKGVVHETSTLSGAEEGTVCSGLTGAEGPGAVDDTPEPAGPAPLSGEEDPGAIDDDPEPVGFDPLLWLSERLREHAKGPVDQYRELIEQRVRERLAEEEEEEEAAAAAKLGGDEEEPTPHVP